MQHLASHGVLSYLYFSASPNLGIHVWQSRVEVKHYSVAYLITLLHFKHSSVELLLRPGLILAG